MESGLLFRVSSEVRDDQSRVADRIGCERGSLSPRSPSQLPLMTVPFHEGIRFARAPGPGGIQVDGLLARQ